MGEDLLDSDHECKRRDREYPRPNASILYADSYDLWLDPGMQNSAAISELLKPDDPHEMTIYPVSTRISRVENDDAECSRPIEIGKAQVRLF